MNSARIFCTTLLLVATVVAEPPANSGYSGGNDLGGYSSSSPSLKGIRYAGPIVYTNERPPVIHFPPPPQASSGTKEFQGLSTRGKSVKYVPMPTHDLPILIYTSDVSPPLHVVGQNHHKASPSAGQSGGYERMQTEYSNSVPSYQQYSSQPAKPKSSSVKKATSSRSSAESYRTVEAYAEKPHKSQSHGKSNGGSRGGGGGGGHGQSFYDRLDRHPLTQSIKDFLRQSPSFKSLTSPSASPRPQKPKRKQSYSSSDNLIGDYSTKNEVVTKPRSTPKQTNPLPHIIYTGHAPIHIFNQSPVYVPKSQSQQHQHAAPKVTHEYQEAESAPRPRYTPQNPTNEPYRFGSSNDGGSGYSKYSKPGFYSGKSQQKPSSSYSQGPRQPPKPTPDYTYNNTQRKPYKPKPSASTKSQYSVRPSSQTSYFSSGSHSSNYIRSSAMAPKRKPSKPTQHKQQYGKSTAPAKQYSSAPTALKKPPIIIYQGLYPPHHVYENPPTSVDYRMGQPSTALQQDNGQPIASRMSTQEGVSMESRVDTDYDLMATQAAPTYYLPALEMNAPAMYVSDLTSQGTAPPQAQYFTVVPSHHGGGVTSPQTHTIQIQNADGSHSTAQVTTITTNADEGVTQSAGNEAHIDSLPTTTFLASGLNNQNNPLVPYQSISSIIVQSAGAQHHL